MKTFILNILLIFSSFSLLAQNSIDNVLASVEANNTTLKALRESVDAQKLENRTGIYLPGPEVGFNYLYGKPGEIGNRTDISVTQSFDIATLFGMKNRVANEQNSLVDLQYQTDRIQLLLEAKQYCLDLIYYNALRKELDLRIQHAQTISEAYKNRLEKGDANRLEFNKAQLYLSTVQGEISTVNVEQNAIRSQLKRLNGGIDVVFDETQFEDIPLPLVFDDWYAVAEQKNPALASIRQEVEISKKQLSLNKAMNLPTFSAGYMSEKVVGERYQGISVGVSIPLWENKNRVKQAKTAVKVAELRETDSKQQLYNQLRILYDRTLGLKSTAQNYRKSLETINNTDLLKKALDAGEISLLDYIVEIGLYYDTVNRALEAEKEYQKAFSELSAVEL